MTVYCDTPECKPEVGEIVYLPADGYSGDEDEPMIWYRRCLHCKKRLHSVADIAEERWQGDNNQ